MNSTDWRERTGAALGLARMGTNAVAAEGELARAASDPVAQVRQAAVGALAVAGIEGSNGEKAIVERLGDGSWAVRAASARALAKRGRLVPEAMPALEACARDVHWQVREAAIEALAEMRYPADMFVPLLRRSLRDSAWVVQAAAAEAAGELGADARSAAPELTKCASGANWVVRERAVRALSRMEDTEGKTPDTMVPERIADARLRMGRDVQIALVAGFLVCVRTASLDERTWSKSLEVLRRSVELQQEKFYGRSQTSAAATVVFCAGEKALMDAVGAWSSVLPQGSGYYDDAKRILFVRTDMGESGIWHETSHLLMDADFGFSDGSWYTGGKGFTAWLNEGVAGLWEGALPGGFVDTRGGTQVVVRVADVRHQILLAALARQGKASAVAVWQERLLPPQIPPMTVDWLLSLSDKEFYRHYVGNGHLSMALAREFILYLNDRGKLRTFYEEYKKGIMTYATRRQRSWNAERVARETLERVLGMPVTAVDADFLKWTTERIADSRLPIGD